MKIKIAYEDTRFSVPEEFTEEAGQCFGVEVERGSNIPLTLSIDAYRSGVCDEDGETILGCLKNRTYCSARALEVKRKLDCDRLLAVTRKLPRPPERSEEKNGRAGLRQLGGRDRLRLAMGEYYLGAPRTGTSSRVGGLSEPALPDEQGSEERRTLRRVFGKAELKFCPLSPQTQYNEE